MMIKELAPEELRTRLDVSSLTGDAARFLRTENGIIGQERAVTALKFGLAMREAGFNIFVSGPPGIGKMTAVRAYLEKLAREQESPPDWCYVNNFDDPYTPRAFCLPVGTGRLLQQDVRNFFEHVRTEITKVFESEEYLTRREQIVKTLDQKRNEIIQQLNESAAKAGYSLQANPFGVMLVPVLKGKVLEESEFQDLPEDTRKEYLKRRDLLQDELKAAMKQVRELERSVQEQLQEADKQVALYIVGGFVEDLLEKYKELSDVVSYLKEMQADLLENMDMFKPSKRRKHSEEPRPPWQEDLPFRKYDVNVLVDNSKSSGAPVIVEDNATYINLFGRVEKESQYGALHTDFTLVKAGALHRANGGYLVLQIENVLRNFLSWESLKRAIRAREIDIEEPAERLGYLSAKTIRPQPIPLNVKVVLVGLPYIYYLLNAHDEEFAELFKVRAEFDTRTPCRQENLRDYVDFLSAFCKKENLRPLGQEAIQKVLEYSSRMAEDQEKLSTHFGQLTDVVRESHFWAGKDNSDNIEARHVAKALDQRLYRSGLIPDRIKEMIQDKMLLIDTSGEVVGQVNGLSVIWLGDTWFGRPGRITATVGPGREGIVDIEREVKLGGPLHSKGVLILGGFLTSRFAWQQPLTLSAKLVFEQSYEGIDGDSASSTELYALLSALSGLPIRQEIAVTGSVNQNGEIQAIGGVNQKVEGFFDVCKDRGLNGEQGVLIPHSNQKNLVLREDVLEAVRDRKFHIWTASTIDEGMELLTGWPAGKRGADGRFPEHSVNGRIERQLQSFARTLKELASHKTFSG